MTTKGSSAWSWLELKTWLHLEYLPGRTEVHFPISKQLALSNNFNPVAGMHQEPAAPTEKIAAQS